MSATESCRVTIGPTITPERVGELAKQVIDKLFPGNAGGVHVFFLPKLVGRLAPLAAEAVKRQQTARLRITRQGFSFTIQPDDQPAPAHAQP